MAIVCLWIKNERLAQKMKKLEFVLPSYKLCRFRFIVDVRNLISNSAITDILLMQYYVAYL